MNAKHHCSAGNAMLPVLLERITWNAVGHRRPRLHQPNHFIGSRLDDISPGRVIKQDLVLIVSATYVSVLPESGPCMCHTLAAYYLAA